MAATKASVTPAVTKEDFMCMFTGNIAGKLENRMKRDLMRPYALLS